MPSPARAHSLRVIMPFTQMKTADRVIHGLLRRDTKRPEAYTRATT
jgi:hypothetical protein